MRLLVILSLSLTALLNVVLGAIVLQRASRRLYGWLFSVTLLAIAVWSIGDMLLLTAKSRDLLHVAAEIFYIAPMIIPVSILLFSYVFPRPKKIDTFIWTGASIVLIGWSAILLWNIDFVFKGIDIRSSLNVPVANLPGFLYYAIHFSVFFILTYIVLFVNKRQLRGVEQAQVTYTFHGVLIASILAMITNLSLPIMGRGEYIWLGPIFTMIFALMVTISIAKHKLFDIRFYVLRGLAYTTTLLILAVLYIAPAVYIMAIGIMGYKFEPFRFTMGVIFATVAALYFENLRLWFDRTTSRIFFRDNYDFASVLSELNRLLVASIDIDVILHNSGDLISRRLKAESYLFLLNASSIADQRLIGTYNKKLSHNDIEKLKVYATNSDAQVIIADYISDEHRDVKHLMLKNNIAVFIKLSNRIDEQGSAELGFVMLGIKRSGNSYNSQDTDALEAMSDVLTIAIQNALRFEEIKNFNITLQQRVDDATAQLRRTNAKLKALDETKDDFISMASHQLRTPLTAVKGYLSMVLEGDAGTVTPIQRKMINQAFVSSQRMVFLIADLLNVSRLKTGKFVIERVPVNLAQMISEEIGQLQEEAATHSLELSYDKPADFPTLLLDETKSRQVVMNFIDNAVHYTQSGGHIHVELKNKPHTIELRVVDDGIGVPKAEQHHLFTKFYRALNARRERPDGTGLGLFMAKKVIAAQGGAVIFESREGKGSTFGFTMPKDRYLIQSSDAK